MQSAMTSVARAELVWSWVPVNLSQVPHEVAGAQTIGPYLIALLDQAQGADPEVGQP